MNKLSKTDLNRIQKKEKKLIFEQKENLREMERLKTKYGGVELTHKDSNRSRFTQSSRVSLKSVKSKKSKFVPKTV